MKIVKYLIQFLFFIAFILVIKSGNMYLWLGLFAVSLISALLFGRFFCGYICPMNSIMKITGKLAKKLGWQKENAPKLLNSKLLPWAVLVLMLVVMLLSKRLLHRNIPVLLLLLVLAAIITLRYEEWVFHNHVCPYGALLRLAGRWASFSARVEASKCIGCHKCERVCPSRAIEFDNKNKVVQINTSLCHQCMECGNVCPKTAIRYR